GAAMPSPERRRRPRSSRPAARPEAAAGARAGERRGLPPVWYTSADVYALEVERILRRGGPCLGPAREVAAPRAVLAPALLGEPRILARDTADAVRVLSAICRHRAMPVAAGAGHTRTFVCPYHNWTYALDGRLLGAPEMTGSPGFDPAACRLPTVRSEV